MKTYSIPLLILAAVLLVVASGCSDGDNTLGANQGHVQFVMSSASDGFTAAATDGSDLLSDASSDTGTPIDVTDDHGGGGNDHHRLAEANVTFSSILARNMNGELIDVDIELPVTVDMLGMRGGGNFDLPMGILPPGIYDQIVVVMTTVELVTLNGTRIAITPPGGGWTSIVRVCPFEIAEGAMTTVQFKFRPKHSFKHDGFQWKFKPEMECDSDDAVVQPS